MCWARRAHGRMDGMVSLCRARDLVGVCNGKSVSGEEGFCAYGMVSLCWVRRAHGRMNGMVSLCRARRPHRRMEW